MCEAARGKIDLFLKTFLKARLLPDTGGYAELLDSSLVELDELTVCARFLTYQFVTHTDTSEPFQSVLAIGKRSMLEGYTALPCDHLWQGCTDYYKAGVGRPWEYKETFQTNN